MKSDFEKHANAERKALLLIPDPKMKLIYLAYFLGGTSFIIFAEVFADSVLENILAFAFGVAVFVISSLLFQHLIIIPRDKRREKLIDQFLQGQL
jgi:hypothetical protein